MSWRRFITLREEVDPGIMSRPWYGVAWYDYASNRSVTYPMPLNWVMMWLHNWYLALKVPKEFRDDVNAEGLHAAAFLRGYERGKALSMNWESGYSAGTGYGYRDGYRIGHTHGREVGIREGQVQGHEASLRILEEYVRHGLPPIIIHSGAIVIPVVDPGP